MELSGQRDTELLRGDLWTVLSAYTTVQHLAYFEEVDGGVHLADVPVRRRTRGHAQQPRFALLDGECR